MRKSILLLIGSVVACMLSNFYIGYLESAVSTRYGYVNADGYPIYYAEWLPKMGEVKGTVILLHGLGGSLEMMRWLGIELARNGYRALAYDNLGHGRSGLRSISFNATLASRIYLSLTEALGVSAGEKLTLIGHSMGGFFAQEIAKIDSRVERVFVVASRPYLNASIERVAVFAALDEIFSPIYVESWRVEILPLDDHLTVLYNPSLADIVLSTTVGEGYVNLSFPRLIATLVSSASALTAALTAIYVVASRLQRVQHQAVGRKPLPRLILAAAAAAPLAFPLYLVLAPVVSLIAAYVLACLYSQAIALSLVYRPRIRLNFTKVKVGVLLKSVAFSLTLFALAYGGLSLSLQPFFNVRPSLFRASLIAAIFALSLPPAVVFESLVRAKLQQTPFTRGLTAVVALRLASFISAYAAARLVIGAQGLSGYLLIVTYVSLMLLIPLEVAAQTWYSKTGSWRENVLWLAFAHSLLLSAVTPLT
ncbi:MAG: alpha/beta hydrolase [Thermofilaceae archaeon]|nr:alpha/beta hydrolase [Thermofilaceae archaeon]